VVQTEADLKKLFPPERWNRLHIQLILYGREHCSARGCDGTVCEICRTLFPDRRPVKTRK
jgi:endonuclease-3